MAGWIYSKFYIRTVLLKYVGTFQIWLISNNNNNNNRKIDIAEMRFLRHVAGYTRRDEINNLFATSYRYST
jgi:hypothetical protein